MDGSEWDFVVQPRLHDCSPHVQYNFIVMSSYSACLLLRRCLLLLGPFPSIHLLLLPCWCCIQSGRTIINGIVGPRRVSRSEFHSLSSSFHSALPPPFSSHNQALITTFGFGLGASANNNNINVYCAVPCKWGSISCL